MNLSPEKNEYKNLTYFAAGLLFLLLLAPVLLISFYTRPHVDDFMVSTLSTSRHGVINAMKYWYFNWTGRFFSIFLLSYLNPLTYQAPALYPFLMFCLIALQLVTSFLFLRRISAGYLDRSSQYLLWVLVNGFYYGFMPGMADGVYWFAGSCMYFTTVILLPVWLMILFFPGRQANNIYWFVSALVTGVMLIGANELALLTVFIVSFLYFAGHSFLEQKIRKDLLLLFFLLFACCLISILAPGNFVRSSQVLNPRKGNLYFTFYSMLALGWMHIRILVFKTPFLVLMALLPLNFYKALIVKVYSVGNKWFKIFIPLAAWGVYLSTFVPGTWSGLGNYSRTLNYAYLIFLMASVLSLAWVLMHFDLDRLSSGRFFVRGRAVLVIVFASVFFIASLSNLRQVDKDLFGGIARQYSKELDARYTVLDHSRNMQLVELDSLANKPLSIYPYEMSGDNFKHLDSNYRIYFHIAKLRFK